MFGENLSAQIRKCSKPPTLLVVAMCELHQVSKTGCVEQRWRSSKEIMTGSVFKLFVTRTGNQRAGRVPENFSKLLLEKRQNCRDSEDHKKAFRNFARRMLQAANASQTRFDKRKHRESLWECLVSCWLQAKRQDGAHSTVPW